MAERGNPLYHLNTDLFPRPREAFVPGGPSDATTTLEQMSAGGADYFSANAESYMAYVGVTLMNIAHHVPSGTLRLLYNIKGVKSHQHVSLVGNYHALRQHAAVKSNVPYQEFKFSEGNLSSNKCCIIDVHVHVHVHVYMCTCTTCVHVQHTT